MMRAVVLLCGVGLVGCPAVEKTAPGPFMRTLVVATPARVTALQAAPGGQRVAVGQNGVLEIRSADGVVERTLPVQPGYITALAWRSDGGALFSGGQGNGLTRWNSLSGALENNYTSTVFPVRAVAVSPTDVLATATGDNNIHTWSASGGELLTWLQQSATLAFVDGQTVMSGGADGFIRKLDAATGQGRGDFNAHLGGVVALTVLGDRVASVGYDGVLRLSSVAGAELATWNVGGTLLNVALLADGRVAAGTSEGDLVVAAVGVNDVGRETIGSAVTALCASGQTLWVGTADQRLIKFAIGN